MAGVKKAEEELGEDDWLIVDSGTNMQEMYMRWILDTLVAQSPHRDLDIPAPAEHQKYQNGFKRWYNRIIGMRANTIFITNSMTLTDEEGNPRNYPAYPRATRDKRLHSASRRSYPILLRIAGISGGRRTWLRPSIRRATSRAFPSMAR